ncbi:MAG: acyltransferase [Pasteurellaceae bacterium]|nr:acyltransferase [Pasteurellaceae bacterium]
MKKQGVFTRDNSHYIQGIAIILMFIHHLFAFPDRMSQKYTIIPIMDSLPLEQLIGIFGKYCVPLCLFISGYGFSIQNQADGQYYFKKIVNFYKNYWLVFAIFIPIDYFIFHLPNINIDMRAFFQNFIGYSSSYNGEWWFIFLYLCCIAITPLLQKTRQSILSVVVIAFLAKDIITNVNEINAVLNWLLAYIIGFAFGTYNTTIVKYINKIESENNIIRLINKIVLIVIFTSITSWCMFHWSYMSMLYLVPLLALAIRFLSDISHPFIRKGIENIGKNCIFMWLTHSFYCYHFAKDLIYFPRYTILILLNLLVVSYITSYLLIKLKEKLSLVKIPKLSSHLSLTLEK